MTHQVIESVINTIEKSAVVPVFYHDDADTCLSVLKACEQAGLTVFEFTNRGEHALQNFDALQNYVASKSSDMLLGIGTILKLKDADPFLLKQARFVVSPALVPAMSEVQTNAYTPWIPGCGTVSEVVRATELGAKLVKIFPGNVLGPAFAASVRSVIPNVKLMPTGGVEPSIINLTQWFDAGVIAVGMGSQLFTKELLAKKDWAGLEKRIKETLAIVKEIRK